MINAIKKVCNSFYQQFILANDSPHRIAFAFSLGVFLGILPFTGVLAAVALAYFFRLNKAAAVLGSVLANPWVGLIVLGIAFNASCLFLNLSASDIQLKFQNLSKGFHWGSLIDPSILKILGVVALGYLIVSILLSFLAYGVCWAVICWHRRPR